MQTLRMQTQRNHRIKIGGVTSACSEPGGGFGGGCNQWMVTKECQYTGQGPVSTMR